MGQPLEVQILSLAQNLYTMENKLSEHQSSDTAKTRLPLNNFDASMILPRKQLIQLLKIAELPNPFTYIEEGSRQSVISAIASALRNTTCHLLQKDARNLYFPDIFFDPEYLRELGLIVTTKKKRRLAYGFQMVNQRESEYVDSRISVNIHADIRATLESAISANAAHDAIPVPPFGDIPVYVPTRDIGDITMARGLRSRLPRGDKMLTQLVKEYLGNIITVDLAMIDSVQFYAFYSQKHTYISKVATESDIHSERFTNLGE